MRHSWILKEKHVLDLVAVETGTLGVVGAVEERTRCTVVGQEVAVGLLAWTRHRDLLVSR
jgi:hypothetical protein